MVETTLLERRILGVALAGAALAGCAANSQPALGPGMAGTPGALRSTALQGGAFLMQTGQLGMNRALRPELRRFATFEVSEQQGIMQAMALQGERVSPPPPTQQQAALMQQLQAANGAEFDRLFVAAQTQGHREALAVYQAIQQSGASPLSDRGIAILAADRIREHLNFLESFGPRG
jgi:putative membrane protein